MARKRKVDAVADAVQAADQETCNDGESATPLSEEEFQKCQKALQKLLKKESDLKIIIDANQTRFREAALAQKEMTTGPDWKLAIEVEDDMKLAFSVGDYVKVDEDTSAYMNCPEGFGFVQEVRGVGAVTMTSVKYASGFDNGHTHCDIPFESITSAVYGQNFAKRVKRVKVECDMYTPSSNSPKLTAHEVDTRLPMEILIDKGGKIRTKERMAQG